MCHHSPSFYDVTLHVCSFFFFLFWVWWITPNLSGKHFLNVSHLIINAHFIGQFSHLQLTTHTHTRTLYIHTVCMWYTWILTQSNFNLCGDFYDITNDGNHMDDRLYVQNIVSITNEWHPPSSSYSAIRSEIPKFYMKLVCV